LAVLFEIPDYNEPKKTIHFDNHPFIADRMLTKHAADDDSSNSN
jgi:hypothetical protein